MSADKNVFTVKDLEGKDLELKVRKPTLKNIQDGQKVYNRAMADALESGAFVRPRLNDILEAQGLWNKEKEAQYEGIRAELLAGEKALNKGGIKLSEAREIALNMRRLRAEILSLVSVRSSLDNNTAEGQADNAKFNFLVSACLVYNSTEQPYFSDLADYLNRSSEPAALEGGQRLMALLYDFDDTSEAKLPENKFLKEHGFVNDDLRLVDKQGRLINASGKLINERGQFINEAGHLVDIEGNLVDDEGNYIFESSPFLDDDGKPLVDKVEEPAPVVPVAEAATEVETVVAEESEPVEETAPTE